MKRFIFLIAVLMPCMVFGQKSKIEFQETSFDFGSINEADGKAVHVFNFKNTGDAPLILTNVRAGCGCTTPEWNRQPVAPGKSGSIKVSFDPRNRPGSFTKSITVNSNAANSVVSLTIRGSVKRRPASPYDAFKYQVGTVRINNNTANLGNIKNTQQLEREFTVINTNEQPATVAVTAFSPAISVSINPSTLKKAERGKISIHYDASKRNEWGFVNDTIEVLVNNKEKGRINVTAQISEDFSAYKGNFENAPVMVLSENKATLEHITPNSTQTHEFYIQNTGKSDLIIRKIKTSDPETTVSMPKKTVKPGKKAKVVITYRTQTAPKTTKIIQLTSNDPQNSVVNYNLIIQTDK